MTVNKLIKLLEKMPPKAKIAVDGSYNGTIEWKYNLVEINPKFVPQVSMHPDWHENQKGKPHYLDMCILGTIVGETLE